MTRNQRKRSLRLHRSKMIWLNTWYGWWVYSNNDRKWFDQLWEGYILDIIEGRWK